MFTKLLTRSGQVRRFSIITDELGDGWELRVEQDSEIVRRTHYADWHRVERALRLIEREVSELEDLGWQAELVTN
jgi:hypothetical protein